MVVYHLKLVSADAHKASVLKMLKVYFVLLSDCNDLITLNKK